MQERLQKLIARAGVASRRRAEELIVSGQVTVNGHTVTQLGSKADPETDHIKVGGKLLHFSQQRIYLVLNKPAGCVATMSDPEGRQSLQDFLHGVPGRVFPAGRLDFHTEGLLLLTNDGELVNRLLKVSGHLEQVYWIKVKGALSAGELHAAQRAAGARLAPLPGRGDAPNPWYEATVTEAGNDALRQTLFQSGHPVEKIRRMKVAGLELGNVEPGKYRMLTAEEVGGLQNAIARTMARPEAAAPVPAPYAGKVMRAPREKAARPRPVGPERFRSDKFAAGHRYRRREEGRPGEGSSKPSFGRGPRPGGARPSRPPEFPKKRWSRPGERSAGMASGHGASRPGGARPFSPRTFSGKPPGKPFGKPFKKSWRKPSGTSAAPTSGGVGRPGGERPAAPTRTFSGKPAGKPWGKPSGAKPKWKGGSKGARGPGRFSGKPQNSKGTNRE
jgi:23S rRNA pseudouridine2605 synthase